MTSLEKVLQEFAESAAKLRGDEKSEARTLLFHLQVAFGTQFICEFNIQRIVCHWNERVPRQ